MFRALNWLRKGLRSYCPNSAGWNPTLTCSNQTTGSERQTQTHSIELTNLSNKNSDEGQDEGKQDKAYQNNGAKRLEPPNHSMLEALGWGSIIVLDLQFGPLSRHRSHRNDERQKERRCPLSQWPPKIALAMPNLYKSVLDSTNAQVVPSKISFDSLETKSSPPQSTESTISLNSDTAVGKVSAEQVKTPQPVAESVEEKEVAAIGESLRQQLSSYVTDVQTLIGSELVQQEKYKEALACFRIAGGSGCSKAIYNIGLCYELGLGTKQNYEKAARYYYKAAELGNPEAAYNLAVFLWNGSGTPEDPEEAITWFTKAAKSGLREAQSFVGVHYVEQGQYDDGLTFLRPAADQKDCEAAFYLGLCYEQGWGVHRDMSTAVEYFTKAANEGHPQATCSLASFYDTDTGDMQGDPDLAAELYQMAADAGVEEAKQRLTELQNKKANPVVTQSTPDISITAHDRLNNTSSHVLPGLQRSHSAQNIEQLSMFRLPKSYSIADLLGVSDVTNKPRDVTNRHHDVNTWNDVDSISLSIRNDLFVDKPTFFCPVSDFHNVGISCS